LLAENQLPVFRDLQSLNLPGALRQSQPYRMLDQEQKSLLAAAKNTDKALFS
jgi:hypothetical protein